MRPYSLMRMFEFLFVAVIEEMVGDSFNPHFTESMTLRSFLSVCMTLRSFPSENLTLRSLPSTHGAGLLGLQLKAHFVVQSVSVIHLVREK